MMAYKCTKCGGPLPADLTAECPACANLDAVGFDSGEIDALFLAPHPKGPLRPFTVQDLQLEPLAATTRPVTFDQCSEIAVTLCDESSIAFNADCFKTSQGGPIVYPLRPGQSVRVISIGTVACKVSINIEDLDPES